MDLGSYEYQYLSERERERESQVDEESVLKLKPGFYRGFVKGFCTEGPK